MKKRRLGDYICVGAVLVSVLSLTGGVVSADSNWADTSYAVYYNGNGGDVSTEYRDKTDDSYVYINHAGDVGVRVAVRVQGASGNYTGMNGQGSYVSVPTGSGYYITNYVNETFKRTVKIRLQLSPTTHSAAYIHGLWSPDSI